MAHVVLNKNQEKKQRVGENNSNYKDNPLRRSDLNLLTVFDAVMQLQNITRAAQMLGMSQPAVSNAVSRLKQMFNDELFVRCGRGIKPTFRAQQIYGPIRQALQLVSNELPGLKFDALTSKRCFSIAISSPLDLLLMPKTLALLHKRSQKITLNVQSIIDENIVDQLRYQKLAFLIDYRGIERADFHNQLLFEDELVLILARNHPRQGEQSAQSLFFNEKHAAVKLEKYSSFSFPYYNTPETQAKICYQGTSLISVMEIVSQTKMVALVPRCLALLCYERLQLKVENITWMSNKLNCYLSWHESASQDKGNLWMKDLLTRCVNIH